MPILNDFEYYKPGDLAEAVALLSRYGDRACVLAGGTDLVAEMKSGSRTPHAVIDIKGIEELGRLEFDGTALHIGARVTFNHLIESAAVREHFPLLAEAAHTVGSVGLRNRATLVGNVCSAVPCLDSGPPLLLYETDVLVTGPAGERCIPLKQWFVGPRKTALHPDELVREITVARPPGRQAGCYVKLGRYRGEDLAQASVAVLALAGNHYRVAFGAVAPVPVRAKWIEALLDGKPLDSGLLEKAKRLVDDGIAPITDIRASREYRSHMCRVMLERGLRAAVSRLTDGTPVYGTALL